MKTICIHTIAQKGGLREEFKILDAPNLGYDKDGRIPCISDFFIPSFIRPKYSFATMPVKPDFSVPPLGEEIKAVIDSEHGFDQAGIVNAIDRVMSHRAAGKVLLTLGK